MSTKTVEKINRNISKLQHEIETLRSFIIGVLGQDKEGKYKPEFTKKILRASSEDAPFVFKDKESFLKKVRS